MARHLKPSALAFALVAILLWGSLAAAAGGALRRIPAGTLMAVSFACAAATLLSAEAAFGRRPADALRPPLTSAALGIYGIFGYHACLFVAFERAAAAGGSLLAEANLLNYLWPLLIVLLSAPILGQRLGGRELLGAFLGLAGTALTVWQGERLALTARHAPVYLLAGAAAAMWASYSCALRRTHGPSALPFAFAAGSLLALGFALGRGDRLHLTPAELGRCAYLGVFPLGLAYACWERAIRGGGDVQRIGVLSYLTPLVSTACLRAFLGTPLTAYTLAGGGLIVLAALVAGFARRPAS